MRHLLLAIACSLALTASGVLPTAQTQERPIRVGGAVRPPERTKTVAPEYPPNAQDGTVILEIKINPEGRVHSARVLRDVPGATDAAIVAVSLWEYLPTLLNGEPVWIVMTVTVPSPWRE